MPVQVQQEQLEPCRVALTIEVPPAEIQKRIDSVFNQFAKRTAVPGFRPGKAPRHLIKRYIDEERVRELAMDQVLSHAYTDALRQAGVEPYQHSEPQVDLPEEEIDPEQGFSFKATVATHPHVHLGGLEGLSARRVVTRIGDEDVERELERLRDSAARFEQVDEPSAVEDRVRAVVQVTVDDVRDPDASFDEPTLIQIGANLPELDEGLTGLKAGEERSFEFNFPDDYVEEEYRGKTAVAYVQVSEVWRRVVPPLDDEFARKVGAEDVEALRTRLRELLQIQADALADAEVGSALVEELIRRSTVHYPEEMIERQVSVRLAEILQALQTRRLTLEDYLATQQKDMAEFHQELREDVIHGLTHTMALFDYATQNGLLVTEGELEEELKRRAEREKVKVSQLRRLLRETGEIHTVAHEVVYRKVAAHLRERAEIREVQA